MDKDFLDKLNKLDPGGVLAYTPLTPKLEECGDNLNKRREIALEKLPAALLCALQDEKCLQDIRYISEKFPDLLPEIYGIAIGLRYNTKLKEWIKYESTDYKDFIVGIRNRMVSEDLLK